MVIVLPNPDYGKKNNKTISIKKAKKIFKDCFKAEKMPNQALTDRQRGFELDAI